MSWPSLLRDYHCIFCLLLNSNHHLAVSYSPASSLSLSNQYSVQDYSHYFHGRNLCSFQHNCARYSCTLYLKFRHIADIYNSREMLMKPVSYMLSLLFLSSILGWKEIRYTWIESIDVYNAKKKSNSSVRSTAASVPIGFLTLWLLVNSLFCARHVSCNLFLSKLSSPWSSSSGR